MKRRIATLVTVHRTTPRMSDSAPVPKDMRWHNVV